MRRSSRYLLTSLALGLAAPSFHLPRAAAFEGNFPQFGGSSSQFVQTDIISNQTGVAAVTNPALLNPSGIAFGPGGDFWIDTVNNGLSLLVDGTGAPTAAGGDPAAGAAAARRCRADRDADRHHLERRPGFLAARHDRQRNLHLRYRRRHDFGLEPGGQRHERGAGRRQFQGRHRRCRL